MSPSDEFFQMFISKVIEAMRNLIRLAEDDTFEYVRFDVLNLRGGGLKFRRAVIFSGERHLLLSSGNLLFNISYAHVS